MTRKDVTNEFIAGLKEVVDSQKPADQQETQIIGGMQEPNLEVEGDVVETEDQIKARKLELRKKKQMRAENGALAQARREVDSAARKERVERMKDRGYLLQLREKAPAFKAGNKKGLTADEKNDLEFLLGQLEIQQVRNAMGVDVDFFNAPGIVFGTVSPDEPISLRDVVARKKQEQQPQPKSDEKPGFWARLFGRKK